MRRGIDNSADNNSKTIMEWKSKRQAKDNKAEKEMRTMTVRQIVLCLNAVPKEIHHRTCTPRQPICKFIHGFLLNHQPPSPPFQSPDPAGLTEHPM